MSFEATFYLACVLLIGVPAALSARVPRWTPRGLWRTRLSVRNGTALAMVAMYWVGFVIYQATGDGMPFRALLLQDLVVIGAIYAKEDWRDCSPYGGFADQMKAAWTERSPWDRAILVLFLPAWVFYLSIADPYTTYWVLYGIGLAQLTLAGWEALHHWLRAHGHKLRAADERPPGLEFTAWRERYG